MTPPMVKVMWTDAQDDAGTWSRVDELGTTPCVVTTVGSLLETTRPAHVSVALSWHLDPDDDALVVGSVLHIPAAMVQTLQYLSAQPAS